MNYWRDPDRRLPVLVQAGALVRIVAFGWTPGSMRVIGLAAILTVALALAPLTGVVRHPEG